MDQQRETFFSTYEENNQFIHHEFCKGKKIFLFLNIDIFSLSNQRTTKTDAVQYVGMHQNPSWSTLGYFLINGRAGSIIIIMCYRYHYLMHQKSLQHTFIKNHEEIYLEVKAKHDLQSSQFWLFIFCTTFFHTSWSRVLSYFFELLLTM